MLKFRGQPSRVRSQHRESGYVMAMSALILVPLLAFTGFAVDVGAWYARAAEIQKTTDAASLAGVALINSPIPGAAEAAALAVAEQNGFRDGFDGISVQAVPLPGDRMRVRITDSTVPQYFTTLFRPGGVSIARESTAEYVPPIRMGSPRNFLGTGNLDRGSGPSQSGLPAGAIKEEFFLAISGPCDRGEDGDLRQTGRLGNNGASNYCTAGTINPEYEDTGYLYGVQAPTGYEGGQIAIEVFDAPFCRSGAHDFPMYTTASNASHFTTTYSLWGPGSEPGTGTPLQSIVMTNSECGTYGGQWRPFFTVTPSAGDTYVVQVTSSNHATSSRMAGANNFSLRARTGGTFQACSGDRFEGETVLHSDTTGITPENCPNVFALEDLSVFVGSDASSAEFFLASIGPEHSGRTLIIELFDPGEGGDTLQVTDPNGNLVGPGNMIGDGFGGFETGVTSFQRSVRPRFPGEVTPGGGWGPFTEHTVDISLPGPAAGPGRATEGSPPRCPDSGPHTGPSCRYNERSLVLEVQLPDNIHAAYGGKTWWRINYEFDTGKRVTDRTTWSVRVEGGPVRLIE